jgi:hypothetical protein
MSWLRVEIWSCGFRLGLDVGGKGLGGGFIFDSSTLRRVVMKVRVVGNVVLKCRCGSKGTSWVYGTCGGCGGCWPEWYVRTCAGGVLVVLFLWVD